MKPQKTIRFTTSFTSPLLGNVWPERITTVDFDLADKYINNGFAVEISKSLDEDETGGDATDQETSILAKETPRRGRRKSNRSESALEG
jgi:hypothetical protein